MKTLSIDIETRSGADLSETGVYRYAEDPAFAVLLFGYAVDDGPSEVIDLTAGEQIPEEIVKALSDPTVIKYAFNASFERICLSRMLGMPTGSYLSPEGWHCTMVWSAAAGLPLSLEAVGTVLHIERPKMTEGKRLIRKFSIASNRGRSREGTVPMQTDLFEDPDWELFKEYNRRDVEAETDIRKRLETIRCEYPALWDEYVIDQQINDAGVLLDKRLIGAALALDEKARTELTEEMCELTGLENPNSVTQLRMWLKAQGYPVQSLDKAAVKDLMSTLKNQSGTQGTVPAVPDSGQARTVPMSLRVVRVLQLRQMLAKSSVKKYQTMAACACADGRARGMFQFYGSRTGRWAGRLIQMQNLPQNHLEDLEDARDLVLDRNYDALKALFGNVPDTLSQLIRTAFVAEDGKRLIVADFSAIEARVIAWLAGEDWRQEVFAKGGDIYCASASQMFKVPVEKHGVNGHLRQKGKIAELALGYGGAAGALKNMGALEMGLTEEELPELVNAWRAANPRICRLWWDVDKCIRTTIRTRKTTETHGLGFSFENGILFIDMPSGRSLCYIHPEIGENITFEGLDAARKWTRLESYGPKFVENIIQAMARDLLMNAMKNLRGARIEMHVHDELILSAGPELSLEEVCSRMADVPEWADGLLLRADGYETPFYKKD